MPKVDKTALKHLKSSIPHLKQTDFGRNLAQFASVHCPYLPECCSSSISEFDGLPP